MRCVICHGENIAIKEVKEELYYNNNIVYVPVKVLTCNTCGERYYDRRTMRFLEEAERKLKTQTVKLKEIGKLLMYG
ncbi:MAG: YgiT-type zinc finger protein [candidate division Zixibacteria bacterium]|nr:YgiT-type zinc finger protein [candidate division Zixibacteria bacterium]